MICNACGKSLSESAKFCPGCGTKATINDNLTTNNAQFTGNTESFRQSQIPVEPPGAQQWAQPYRAEPQTAFQPAPAQSPQPVQPPIQTYQPAQPPTQPVQPAQPVQQPMYHAQAQPQPATVQSAAPVQQPIMPVQPVQQQMQQPQHAQPPTQPTQQPQPPVQPVQPVQPPSYQAQVQSTPAPPVYQAQTQAHPQTHPQAQVYPQTQSAPVTRKKMSAWLLILIIAVPLLIGGSIGAYFLFFNNNEKDIDEPVNVMVTPITETPTTATIEERFLPDVNYTYQSQQPQAVIDFDVGQCVPI